MLPGALAAALLAGCADSLPLAGVIDGTLDYEHPSVVRISWGGDSGTTCSGTYIGAGRVLTALHCVPTDRNEMISVTFVDYHDTQEDSAQVESASHDEEPPDAIGDGLARVIIGDSSVAALPFQVTPMPVLPENAFSASDVFTAIGFGATSAPTVTDPQGAGYGTRHQGRVSLSSLSDDMAWAVRGTDPDNAAPCHGDSGGPLVVTREGVDYLVGVLLDGDCSTEMQYIRADLPPNSTYVDSPVTPPMMPPPDRGGGHSPDTICAIGSPSGAISVLGVLFVVRRRRSRSPACPRSKVPQPDR